MLILALMEMRNRRLPLGMDAEIEVRDKNFMEAQLRQGLESFNKRARSISRTADTGKSV